MYLHIRYSLYTCKAAVANNLPQLLSNSFFTKRTAFYHLYPQKTSFYSTMSKPKCILPSLNMINKLNSHVSLNL